MALQRPVLTTGEVARICHVAPRTVSKWFDSGQLRGYRIPGSKDRRIPVDQLVRFMKANGIPLDGLDEGIIRILLLDGDPPFTQAIRRILEEHRGHEVVIAHGVFAAGVAAKDIRPTVMVVDLVGPDIVPSMLVKTVRTDPTLRGMHLVAVMTAGGAPDVQKLLQMGFAHVLVKPFEGTELLRVIDELCGVPA